MPRYVFAYHGSTMPESPDEAERLKAAWGAWFGTLGDAVVDGGAPLGIAKTVSAAGVADGGGANPVSGYTIVQADTIDAAVALAQGCPILEHGSIEVAEVIEM